MSTVRSNKTSDIVDKVIYEVTVDGVDCTYTCVAIREGLKENEIGWAIMRVHEKTVGSAVKTVVRWAKKSNITGDGAYFAFKASEYREADNYLGG